jgi:hypothetical protein
MNKSKDEPVDFFKASRQNPARDFGEGDGRIGFDGEIH